VWGIAPTSQIVQGVLIWSGRNSHTHNTFLNFEKKN